MTEKCYQSNYNGSSLNKIQLILYKFSMNLNRCTTTQQLILIITIPCMIAIATNTNIQQLLQKHNSVHNSEVATVNIIRDSNS